MVYVHKWEVLHWIGKAITIEPEKLHERLKEYKIEGKIHIYKQQINDYSQHAIIVYVYEKPTENILIHINIEFYSVVLVFLFLLFLFLLLLSSFIEFTSFFYTDTRNIKKRIVELIRMKWKEKNQTNDNTLKWYYFIFTWRNLTIELLVFYPLYCLLYFTQKNGKKQNRNVSNLSRSNVNLYTIVIIWLLYESG